MDVISTLNEISLRNLSTFTLAARLWESVTVKKEIEKHVACNHSPVSLAKIWNGEITEKVLNQVNFLDLPRNLEVEIEPMIRIIGDAIFCWVHYALYTLNFDFKFSKKIYWTPYGTIDDYRIYQDWKKDPDFRGAYCKEKKVILYCMACVYADEEFLLQSLKDVAETIDKFLGIPIKDYSKFKLSTAMAIFLCYYLSIDGNKCRELCNKCDSCMKSYAGVVVHSKFQELYKTLKDSEYPGGANKLFKYCLMENVSVRAAEYFYKKLKGSDRETLVVEAATEGLNYISQMKRKGRNFQTERFPEYLIYLLNKMSKAQRRKFLLKEIVDVKSLFFASAWPYNQLCVPILDYVWNDLPVDTQIRIIDVGLATLRNFILNRDHYNTYQQMYKAIMQCIFTRLPKETKINSIKELKLHLVHSFARSEFIGVTTIVKDADLSDYRSELINISDLMCEYLIKNGRCENVNEYMRQLKFSDEEKKEFTKFSSNSSLVEALLRDGRVNEVDSLIKWQCDSEAEIIRKKKELTGNINPISMCSILIENDKHDLIIEYLKWHFDYDNEEFEKIKNKIFSLEFIRAEFCRISMCNIDFPEKVDKLFKFFLRIEDVIIWFKKEKLIKDESFIKIFCELSDNKKNLEKRMIDDMFDFCSISTHKINEIKQKIKRDINWWLDAYGLGKKKFFALNAIIDWACTKDERKHIISNFINSAKGALFCTEICEVYFKLHYGTAAKRIILFEWVKPYGDIEKMKNEIKKLNRSDDLKDEHVLNAIKLLDRLNQRCKN